MRTIALVSLSWVALPAAGHHSPAMFDLSQEVVLEGTLTEVSWRNPHVYFGVEIEGPAGERTVQQVEAGPPSSLAGFGFSAEAVRPGERVVVRARPNRSGPGRVMLGWSLTTADGAEIPLHARAAGPTVPGTAEATSIAGTWVPQATGFARLAAGARGWPLTEEGRAAMAEMEDEKIAARSACVPFGPPALMALPAVAIVTVDDARVTFRLDAYGVERVVHLDRQERPAQPTLLGHSTGHWDGDTLVVETQGFTAHPEGYAFDLPSSAAKRIIERFTLSADRKHLDYEAIVEDPQYLAALMTHHSQWDYRPERQPTALPCDEEAAGRFATGE